MPKFIVCRTYAVRYRWTVEAEDSESALALLDATTMQDELQFEDADEEFQGTLCGLSLTEMADAVTEIEE